jgi:hypothetical protein
VEVMVSVDVVVVMVVDLVVEVVESMWCSIP